MHQTFSKLLATDHSTVHGTDVFWGGPVFQGLQSNQSLQLSNPMGYGQQESCCNYSCKMRLTSTVPVSHPATTVEH